MSTGSGDGDKPRPKQDSGGGFDEEEPKFRTGRFHVQHRGGTRVEVGDPVNVGGDRPWMCAVKLVGPKRDQPDDPDHPDPTQTLLVRTGRGATADDARRDALSHLTLVYGSPVAPPPTAVIMQKPSDPPPPPDPPPAPPAASANGNAKGGGGGFWARLVEWFGGRT